MPYFINPNNPIQPIAGVYRWFLKKPDSSELTLYVGKSTKSTLKRAVDQINKTPKHHNMNGKVYFDTNYILGRIIETIEANCQIACYWEHACNYPGNEVDCAKFFKPVLQEIKGNTVFIKSTITASFNSEDIPSTCLAMKTLISEDIVPGNFKNEVVGEFISKCDK